MTRQNGDKDDASDELNRLLSNPDVTEGPLQALLEQYSELVPVTDRLNHDVQWNAVVSKLVLPSGKEVDLAYVTKSTAVWRIVLIELERPNRQLFIETPHPEFHSATRGPISQINVWKTDAENDLLGIKNRLYPLMHMGGHWDTNPIEVCYVLVTGRNPSGRFSRAQSRLVYQLHREQRIRLLTWDSLLRMREEDRRWRLNVLVQKDGRASFKRAQADTNIFSEFHADQVDLPTDQEAWFRAEGYDIDRWRKGDLLVLNHKYPADRADSLFEETFSALEATSSSATPPKDSAKSAPSEAGDADADGKGNGQTPA